MLAAGILCACTTSAKEQNADTRLHDHIVGYWNALDTDTLDAAALEQHKVDFVYVVQHADSATRREAWRLMAEKFDAWPDELVVDYMGQSDSPLYAPGLLVEYLQTLRDALPADNLSREVIGYMIEEQSRNLPGTEVADIDLITDGTSTTLHTLIGRDTRPCMLIFYDPDCSTCNELTALLGGRDLSAYNVVAVNTTTLTKDLPANWTDSRAADFEQLHERFSLPALPSVYFINPDLTVEKRDAIIE